MAVHHANCCPHELSECLWHRLLIATLAQTDEVTGTRAARQVREADEAHMVAACHGGLGAEQAREVHVARQRQT